MAEQLEGATPFARAFQIFSASRPTDLQEAITRAVFWFSDAHRDSIPVMRFVKYWSCVECFFSLKNDDITQSVSVGLASALTHGPFGFVREEQYSETKQRIAKMYGLRSRAVHRAMHDHVTDDDVASLSQWSAWLIVNMIALDEEGQTDRELILSHFLTLASTPPKGPRTA